MFSLEPPKIARSEPITPAIRPTERARRLPPLLVRRASGRARAAAPSTDEV